MGGKKKAAAKKKDEEPDESTEKLFKLYKKKCNELGCPFSSILKEKFNEAVEEGTHLTKVSTQTLSLRFNCGKSWDGLA